MNKKLKEKILLMAKKDQILRKKVRNVPDEKLVKAIQKLDWENTEKMKKIVNKYSYPSYSLVGKKVSEKAWLLVQHADHDVKFQKKCLNLMKKLDKNDISIENIAYLTDRILVNKGKKQKFGTQFYINEKGNFTYRPIKDMKNLEKRRKEYGLQPLKEYIKLMGSLIKK